jgi:hypothetical protein
MNIRVQLLGKGRAVHGEGIASVQVAPQPHVHGHGYGWLPEHHGMLPEQDDLARGRGYHHRWLDALARIKPFALAQRRS